MTTGACTGAAALLAVVMSRCVSSQAIPSNSSIAILLRGSGFRCSRALQPEELCCSRSRDPQLAAARSLVRFVIQPLEARSNRVALFVTESSGKCPLVDLLLATYGRTRIVAKATAPSRNQLESLNSTLALFARHRDADYDFVIVARHDLLWKQAIDTWRVDFDAFNFLSRCERPDCVNDQVHLFPMRDIAMLRNALSRPGCFDRGPHARFHGHSCHRHIGNSWRFLTDFQPRQGNMLGVRDPNNPIAAVMDYGCLDMNTADMLQLADAASELHCMMLRGLPPDW